MAEPSETVKLQEEVDFLKKKLIKSENDLKSSLERYTTLKEKFQRMTSYNEELEEQLKKLSEKIQQHRSKKDNVSIGTQVAASDFEKITCQSGMETDSGLVDKPKASSDAAEPEKKDDSSAEPMSIAESLKAAAEEVVQQSGYVYDEKSGMYYDYNTGYYYDNEKALYYDPASGTYFYYDHATSEYKFHSQVSWHQYTTADGYTDLDAPRSRKEGSSRKTDGKEDGTTKSRRQHGGKGKVKEEDERNGRESRHKHKKENAHEKEEKKEKHKKKKKKKDEEHSDGGKKRKKRKQEKDEKDEEYSRHEKKKRKKDKVEKERDLKRDEEEKGTRRKKNASDGNERNVPAEVKVPSKDPKAEKNELGGKVRGSNRKTDKGDDKYFRSCDIFDEIVTKKSKSSSQTEKMIIDEREKKTEAGKGDRCGEGSTEEGKVVEAVIDISSESELEEGEINDLSTSSSPSLSSSSDSESESDSNSSNNVEEHAKAWPPSVRAMVKTSDVLDQGSLYLITYTGGTIGREKDLGLTILIQDPLVSKMHAELKYNEELKRYVVIDHASQNGTFVNGERVCEPKVMGEPRTLFNGDELRIGGTTFDLHIHPGTDTCEGCEPGLVQAQMQQQGNHGAADLKVVRKEDKEIQRRKHLKQIKRKFGLENQSYVDDNAAIKNPNYQDKASERRKTKGSDNPYQKDDAPASVDRAISTENKGHKLLQKMGWTEGESLGKSRQKGLKEPIKVNIRSKPQAGLGSGFNIETSLDNVESVKKKELWAKMQQRYSELEGQKEAVPDRGGWVSGGVVADTVMDVSATDVPKQTAEAGAGGVTDIQDIETKQSAESS